MVSQSLTQVVNRLADLVPGDEDFIRQRDYEAACTCKDCGETITASEIIEGEERLLKAGLDEGTAQALSPRCERCISVALAQAQDIAAIVTTELLMVALEVAARGTGRVFIAYSKDDRGNHISVTTNNAVVKEMRNRPRQPGQALLYLGRIA